MGIFKQRSDHPPPLPTAIRDDLLRDCRLKTQYERTHDQYTQLGTNTTMLAYE